ncbi:MAG: UDP-N-acetylmuramoyl-L-alanine--D-glutamate ligase [Candidatus Omnitrophota bacterium]|nr:UDP-N-acetylmuramoyl-L-alanine--D-glutamate ligase [Candidatus Omnitrophota bacterium]
MIDVKGKKVLVVGLGISGYAAAELLSLKGARVRITESEDTAKLRERLEKLADYRVRSELGGHTKPFCADAELVVTSPGVDPGALPLSLAAKKGIPVVGELELGYWFCRAPIIAVTGTNGKSTTTEMIGRIISLSGRHAVVCGNIGNPLSGEVGELADESIAVVEVSSFQLETIKRFRPHIAVLLNVSEDHRERHGSYGCYKAQKFRIFENQTGEDRAVLHSDFYGDPMTEKIKSQLLFFGSEKKSHTAAKGFGMSSACSGTGGIVKAEEIPLEGVHNMNNVICSVLVSRIMGIGDRYIREGIVTFRGLDHRFEKIGSFGGVEFIDDSKATNIDATRWALESVDRKVVLIAGGRDKGGNYFSILPLAKEKVKAMVLIGEAREKIKIAFSESIPVLTANDMAEAVRRACAVAREGEAVVLSPMCSSFDMFSSYKERGEVFQREVREQFQKI